MASQVNPKTASMDRDTVLGLFDVPDRDSVVRYLDEHEKLIPVLAEARQEIPKYFPDSRLELSLSVDVDDPTIRELFIYIYTADLPSQVAIQHLHDFDKNWFWDADKRSGRVFNVNLR